ncbi:hypothetical protein HKCCSP123_19430, partial [Rhodobacterales bacterium HKCCSP123]|nr:hypothetical protein [Rhodobacterales bacterium HKCCSP123]
MNGTVIAQAQARISNSVNRLGDSPNTVIAALVLSTCVAALAGYVVVSQALPHVVRQTPVADVTAADVPNRPVPRPGARVRPALSPADPAVIALGFADPGVERRTPAALDPQEPAEAPSSRLYMPVRVVAGRPAIVPPQRPAAEATGVLRLARGITPARALGLPTPVARPDTAPAEAAVAVAALATESPRPSLR